jgi:peptide chain release factor subunit 1
MNSMNNVDEVEIWKIKNLLKRLSKLRGSGGSTSVITLILPPGEQVAKTASMLTAEYGTAVNIKSRVNRQSVQDAIQSTIQKLKLYNRVPDNGLIVLSGNVDIEGKEKRMCLGFEPPRKINKYLYLCDSKFHLESIGETLDDFTRVGYIIIDGDSTYYAYVTPTSREKIESFEVDLPPKHGRGGQSKNRFERIAEEKRHNYITKVVEKLNQHYIGTDGMPNITNLFIAGSAYMKDRLLASPLIDYRIKKVIHNQTISVSYGGENGLREAIQFTREQLGRSSLKNEEDVLMQFVELIAKDKKLYCFGKVDTMSALGQGILDTLIVSDECAIRLELTEVLAEVLSLPEIQDAGSDITLVEYLIAICKVKNTKIKIVTKNTSLGMQFHQGFGGLGGILRYEYDFTAEDLAEGNFEESPDDDKEHLM